MTQTPFSQTVAVVDYGMGNLRSVSQAVAAAAAGSNTRVVIAQDAATVRDASRIVLPGQGAMPECMAALDASGMRSALLERIAQGTPLLGICVGMQMLLDASDEGPSAALGLVAGQVRRLPLASKRSADGSRLKIPHMGWNRVWWGQGGTHGPAHLHPNGAGFHPMWADIDDGAWFYFVHSFYADPVDNQNAAARTHYGVDFVSAIARDNLFATQFHPEKSAAAGLQLFKNFLNWQP